MKSKYSTEKTAQASIRLSMSEHRDLTNEALNQGTTLSDVVRQRIRNSEQQITLSDQLAQLEKRILKQVFNICCVVANLNEDEKQEAKIALNQGGRSL